MNKLSGKLTTFSIIMIHTKKFIVHENLIKVNLKFKKNIIPMHQHTTTTQYYTVTCLFIKMCN